MEAPSALYAVGVMDEPAGAYNFTKLQNNVTTESSVALARSLAAEAHVLLKNEGGVLPLRDRYQDHCIRSQDLMIKW